MPGEPRMGRTDAELVAQNKRQCPRCELCFHTHGFERHRAVCEREARELQDALRATKRSRSPEIYLPEPKAKKTTHNRPPSHPQNTTSHPTNADYDQGVTTSTDHPGFIEDSQEVRHASTPDNTDMESTPQLEPERNVTVEEGSIRITYPYRPQRLYERDIIFTPEQQNKDPSPVFGTGTPWEPFRTREDFTFARVTLNTPAPDVDVHIGLHRGTNSRVTFKNSKELQTFENRAAQLLTDFDPVAFTVDYKPPNGVNQTLNFQAWVKPLLEWSLELIQDESVQKKLQFDAEQKYRWSDGAWIQFVDEPWTTPGWERAQSSLPDDGLPLMIQLYADKSAISSFGGKKMYPVTARLLNLPREIRNGKGVGGGRIVALLPVVEGEQSETGTTQFANLKCAVWHKAMEAVLESIRSASHLGHAVKLTLAEQLGLKGQHWRVFPIIMAVSADYEEQIIMATHRGLKALNPCVRCDTPDGELHNLAAKFKIRDPDKAEELIGEALGMAPTRAEKFLRPYSYRPIKNAFFTLHKRTNLFAALSYDTLHNDDLGRWGKHLWPLLKTKVNESGVPIIKDFESRIDAVPRWPDLNHYSNALSVDFTDGRKYEDLLKAELRIVASLEVQTTRTVALGRELVGQFDLASKECTKLFGKNFEFPKMHLLVHLFDDVWDKGVTSNFSTKPSESLHRILRKAYDVSSKKNATVDAEVLRKTHLLAVYELIQSQIDLYDQLEQSKTSGDMDPEETDNAIIHVTLGSKPRKFQSLGLIEDAHRQDEACVHLDRLIRECLDGLHCAIDPLLPIKARECNLLKVQYESFVDWCSHRDMLRCNPKFHSQERYDCVLVDSDEGISIARLLLTLDPGTSIHHAHGACNGVSSIPRACKVMR
ncbi:hypothetical protein FRC08_012260 [Ceratobasidium sp. 394]|nr:hypothetical protein FRC08_012260 [Ceratobasidium sp. 394]